jgi:hypothetical protein
MITRNRIKCSEKQAALMWQQLAAKKLTTTEDGLISVIYPGRSNGDNGPDFRDAVILTKSHLTKGDVEVHVKSSDWYSHKHHVDAEYNNVILHVVMWHDCNSATLLQSGKLIPVLCLAKALRRQPYLLPHQLPCFRVLEHMDRQTLGKILEAAGEAKFHRKAMYFRGEILRPALRAPGARDAAGQVLFRGMMRALGYAKNTKPFEDLANRMPLNFLESTKGLTLKQALLLGTAGLLPTQRRQRNFAKGKEVQELEQIWQSAGKKIETMDEDSWTLSHIYPNNSPIRRIVAQSYILERYYQGRLLSGILQLVKEAPVPGGQLTLENRLTVADNGYWRDHFDFDVRSRTKRSALLGYSKAGEIIVNVILPFAFSWGEIAGAAELMTKAVEIYNSYPKLAENQITRHMREQLCLEESFDFTACSQLGLIHIFRDYCREGRCAECPLVS